MEHQAKSMGYETVFCHVDINDAQYQMQINEILSDTESAVVLLGTEMLEEDFEPFTHAKNKDKSCWTGGATGTFFDSVLISKHGFGCKRRWKYLAGKGT